MTNPAKTLGARAALEAVDAELPTETFPVIFDAAAIRDIGALQTAADAAEAEIMDLDQRIQFITLDTSSDVRYGEESPADDLREQRAVKQGELDGLNEQIAARRATVKQVSVTLRAMPFGKWEALRRAHPGVLKDEALTGKDKPRQYIDDDGLGVHAETFFPLAVRACMVVPSVVADDDWEYFAGEDGKVHGGEWTRICIKTWLLNGRTLDVPKLRTTSGATPMSVDG